MRALVCLPLLLAGCGPKPLTLPEDPIRRAATCGVVAAAAARQGADVKAKLPFEAQAKILHYALLEGAAGATFDKARAATVANTMSTVGDTVTAGEWQALQGPCDQAYPAAARNEARALPDDRLIARLGCDGLAAFMTTALREDESAYAERLRALAALQRAIDDTVGPALRARGIGAGQSIEARDAAMARLIRLGPPAKVLDACVAAFGG